MASKIKSEIILVTPEMATKYLCFNEQNRRVRPGWVNYLAYVIRNGEWKATHQGIAFSESGRLLDGQHRLMAIVKADISVNMLVTYGLDDQTFSAIDNGIKRTDEDLTGICKPTIEIIKFLVFVTGFEGIECASKNERTSKITPTQINFYNNQVGFLCEFLQKEAPTRSKVFGSTPVRTAAIVAMMLGESPDYVITTYRQLTLGDTQSMSPICHSAVRQVLTGRITTKGGEEVRIENFVRFLPVFKKANQHTLKLIRRDCATVLQEIRKPLKPWFSNQKESRLNPKIEQVRSEIYKHLSAA